MNQIKGFSKPITVVNRIIKNVTHWKRLKDSKSSKRGKIKDTFSPAQPKNPPLMLIQPKIGNFVDHSGQGSPANDTYHKYKQFLE